MRSVYVSPECIVGERKVQESKWERTEIIRTRGKGPFKGLLSTNEPRRCTVAPQVVL
jgi:hypothetical protein